MKNVIGPGGVRYPVTPDIERFLRSMDRRALQSLVLEMAAYSPEAMRSLQLRATPEDEPTASELLTAVDAALAGVDLDYHDPFYEDVDDGVQGIEEAVDELERHLDGGSHPVVRRVLQHLLTRLGDLARDADNADALLEVAERVSALFGRAVAGHPEAVSLARWLVGFRVEYGGWPSLTLDAVAHAFDEPAWDAYRASVATLGGGGPAADPYRSETDRMLLELADHDGDIDRAVALLSGGERPYYREIIGRLRDAGRPADVLAWLDRAVNHGCVDVTWRAGPTIVPVEDAVDAYLDGGRPDAALAIARTLFERDLSVDAFRLLSDVAARCGRYDEQRTWAFEQATQRARSSGGAHLVGLHLADGNVTQAWEAADAFGAGHAWRELVDASEDGFPLRAARLCLAQVLESLTTPDSKRYPAIVDLLVKARTLDDTAGHRAEADAEIKRLREAYRRRPALMSAMNRTGLPPDRHPTLNTG